MFIFPYVKKRFVNPPDVFVQGSPPLKISWSAQPSTWNLYSIESFSGTVIVPVHNPFPSSVNVFDVPFQPLKSPITLTILALGAQTAKYVPFLLPFLTIWLPSLS